MCKKTAGAVTEQTTQKPRMIDTFQTSLAAGPAGEFEEIPMDFGIPGHEPTGLERLQRHDKGTKAGDSKKARNAETKEQMHRIVSSLASP